MDIPARSLVFCYGNSMYFVIVFLILTAVAAVPVYQSTYLLILNSEGRLFHEYDVCDIVPKGIDHFIVL